MKNLTIFTAIIMILNISSINGRIRPIRPPFPRRESERILAHILTDKPVYKPNDVMFVELYLIDAFTK